MHTKTASGIAAQIHSFYSGIAQVQGLQDAQFNEVLVDEAGAEVALVIGFNSQFVEALFFDHNFDIKQPVFKSGRVFSIPVSDQYLGRVVSGLGAAIDGLPQIKGELKTVFAQAPGIIERSPVKTPLATGIKILDTTLPIGRGQRELIIGDRQTGKSAIALDTVLNQTNAKPAVYCIYVLCGANADKIERTLEVLQANDAFLNTVLVVAKSDDALAQQYLAPFVGCTIAEYFRDRGQDALVIYDDLSKHAKAYRDISLLLERPPGRETYPGDIFTQHATLLERACQLSKQAGGGSLTALPILETQEGDITSFISTNVISICDGQIYLEKGLFEKGFIPAVNVGLSVSRIGSAAQPELLHSVTGGIRLALAQHNQLQKLVQLETVMSKETQSLIDRGDLILEMLKQDKHQDMPTEEEIILFYGIEAGLFDDVSLSKLKTIEELLLNFIRIQQPALLQEVASGSLGDEAKAQIKTIITNLKLDL